MFLFVLEFVVSSCSKSLCKAQAQYGTVHLEIQSGLGLLCPDLGFDSLLEFCAELAFGPRLPNEWYLYTYCIYIKYIYTHTHTCCHTLDVNLVLGLRAVWVGLAKAQYLSNPPKVHAKLAYSLCISHALPVLSLVLFLVQELEAQAQIKKSVLAVQGMFSHLDIFSLNICCLCTV